MACPYLRASTIASQVAPAGPKLEQAPPQLSRCPAAAALYLPPADYAAELRACRDELYALLDSINCNPILVRAPPSRRCFPA